MKKTILAASLGLLAIATNGCAFLGDNTAERNAATLRQWTAIRNECAEIIGSCERGIARAREIESEARADGDSRRASLAKKFRSKLEQRLRVVRKAYALISEAIEFAQQGLADEANARKDQYNATVDESNRLATEASDLLDQLDA